VTPQSRIWCALLVSCGVLDLAQAQEEGTTPGAIANPGSYEGSMRLQQEEQQQYQQQQQQNEQMLQRLDQNYQQYAPGSAPGGGPGRGAGGPPPVNWWSRPALPAEKNPLLGHWKQTGVKKISAQQIGGPLGGLMGPGTAEAAANMLGSTLAEGCKSIFGSGVVAFEPDALQWVAPDGHEEILNHVTYRASGSEVVVLSRDAGTVTLIFGFPNRDHAVVALFKCTMERVAAARPGTVVQSSTTHSTVASAPPAGSPNSVLNFQAGAAGPGSFTPFPDIELWVTRNDPRVALAKVAPAASGSLADTLAADCRMPATCIRDFRAMVAGALGAVRTDTAGMARTPSIPAGQYYVVGLTPYQGKRLLWARPVKVQPGSNTVTLDQNNGNLF